MVKNLIIFLFVVMIPLSIDNVRELYKGASKSKEKSDELYQALQSVKTSDDALLVGYKAASVTLKAKFAKEIKIKKELFKQGATLLEQQIEREPQNIELRLIRLSIQENTPKILKYHQNITEDKEFIINNISFIKNKNELNYFKDFIAQSKSFTDKEKKQF